MFFKDNSRQAGLLGYVAGFFDGEGNIGSGTKSGPGRNAFFMKMVFSQNNSTTLEEIRRRIYEATKIETGVLQEHTGYNKLSDNTSYALSFQGSKAYELAKALLPWIVAKRDYLEWIIYTWENRMSDDGKTTNMNFLERQHEKRPGRRAAATTKRKGAQ